LTGTAGGDFSGDAIRTGRAFAANLRLAALGSPFSKRHPPSSPSSPADALKVSRKISTLENSAKSRLHPGACVSASPRLD